MTNSTAVSAADSATPAPGVEPPYVLAATEGPVLTLTLNRPAQRNPLSSGMIAALASEIEAAGENPLVRVVVICAAGPVFSAGHDLRELGRQAGESLQDREHRVRRILADCAAMMQAIVHCPRAVIASVHGIASAAGCQLVSACDLALASEAAQFCTPGVNIGTFCTTPLVGIGRNIHRKHAMEMALTGDLLPAADALRFGLVNRVVPAPELERAVSELAHRIAGKSAQAIRSGKEAFYRQVDMPLEQAFEYAGEAMLRGVMCEDAAEGTRAFLEKRKPVWGKA